MLRYSANEVALCANDVLLRSMARFARKEERKMVGEALALVPLRSIR